MMGMKAPDHPTIRLLLTQRFLTFRLRPLREDQKHRHRLSKFVSLFQNASTLARLVKFEKTPSQISNYCKIWMAIERCLDNSFKEMCMI